MGSPKTEPERAPDETQRNVTIERGFYLGKYEVTQEQYEIMMRGNPFKIDPNPSYFANQPNCPVENISLDEIEVFLNRLNHRLSDIGGRKRLAESHCDANRGRSHHRGYAAGREVLWPFLAGQ